MGFAQKEGIHFNEIFSPVVKFTTVRVVLALVAQFNWELDRLDVKTAFLNGDLEETIFMKQHKDFEVNKNSDFVCLQKSLYGLKQVSRQWYKRFDTFVLGLGFKRSNFDTCLYCKGNGGKNSLYLLLYVDDMILAIHDIKEIELIKDKLKS
ncbi:reverse transcriptase [Olea europaea subsp. europaea]|uniref:Reverse transcriptase, partial n=1 Tax=Olea europaea subsp. europaea TaxID=158383 RepID=A0A8S0SYF9_OLEEU|nr:reverse transcriptase [Olea europaea subsp. europaea]